MINTLLSAPDLTHAGAWDGTSTQAPEDDEFFVPTAAPTVVLQSVPVPLKLAGATFLELFVHMVGESKLPVALVRARGCGGALLPYVFTCPPTTAQVNASDKVLVVAPVQ